MLEAENAEAGLREATLRPVDLIVVDLGLPDLDGAAIVERVRSWSSGADHRAFGALQRGGEGPAARTRRRRLRGQAVRHGGTARAGASRAAPPLARRRRRTQSARSGRCSIDLATRSVSIDGTRLPLSPKEYRLLQVLAQHAGNVVTHQFLLKEVWGVKHVHDAHYLRIFVRKLRRKIEKDPTQPPILVTELGVGYRLAQDELVAD